MYIFPFRVDEFLDDVISVSHFEASDRFGRFIFGIRLDLEKIPALLCKIQNIVYKLDDLDLVSINLRSNTIKR